ncbi:hypothetical protein K3G63_10860 [Hymenobacter sp. HSC-4F20]|uniref:hypothetical protein n=1 Tax=Hymenobacter sp. HSC-4F20 TaxID=2864135 RepID=UPI001C735514|nr:hypothetical protein [Hymenobacter sp. HSC-4F20]MBX0290942.1 hypothetical protein [Hymenobacter sp. HSC-4F20]
MKTSNTMTNDEITDAVNEWVANNPERLSYCYDNTTAFITWKREAFSRVERSDEPVNEVLEAWATEAEATNA